MHRMSSSCGRRRNRSSSWTSREYAFMRSKVVLPPRMEVNSPTFWDYGKAVPDGRCLDSTSAGSICRSTHDAGSALDVGPCLDRQTFAVGLHPPRPRRDRGHPGRGRPPPCRRSAPLDRRQ
jgi:hypothetical protein